MSILDRIGNTPLVALSRIGADLQVPVLVKCEHMNPGGSVKDRIAKAIVDDAEARDRGGLGLDPREHVGFRRQDPGQLRLTVAYGLHRRST